jgi:sugar (pentulose or hexulose) kinase
MDESDASCTYLFDARANAWSPILAGKLGVDPELLPPVQHASAVIGVVTSEAAGPLSGTPVAAGTSDFAATLLEPASRASIAAPTSPALRR